MKPTQNENFRSEGYERKFAFDVTPGSTAFVPCDDGSFEEKLLGLGAASDGLVTAKLLRSRGSCSNAVKNARTDGHLVLYVLRGEVALKDQSGADARLPQGSAVYFPPDFEFTQSDWTYDLEMLWLAAPSQARSESIRKDAVYDKEGPDSYQAGAAGRDYLSFRPLRFADHTQRQFEITLIRGLRSPEGGTGWHFHTNSEWVYIVSGAAEMALAGHQNFTLRAGDSMTIPPRTVHAVPQFSGDYTLIAVNAPADFKTESAAAPH